MEIGCAYLVRKTLTSVLESPVHSDSCRCIEDLVKLRLHLFGPMVLVE